MPPPSPNRSKLALSGVFALATAAALLLGPAPALAGNGLDLVNKIPRGFSLLFGVDMGRVRKSPMFKVWQKGLKDDARRGREYAEFVRRLGFDPTTDVESIVVAADLTGGKDPRFLTVAKGNFNPAESLKRLMEGPKKGKKAKKSKKGKKGKKGKAEEGEAPEMKEHLGVKYVLGDQSGRPIAFAITKDTALVGIEESVKEGIALMKGKGGKSADDDERLMKLARRAATGGVGWIAVVLPDTIQASPEMGPAGALATARDIFGTVRIAAGLEISITSICPDAGIAAGLQQALAIGLAAAQRNPVFGKTGLGRVLAKVKTDVNGKELITSLKLEQGEFQELLDQVASKVGVAARPGKSAAPKKMGRKTK